MTLPATKRDVLVTATTEATSLMEVIARAASDPACDVTKLERLWEMYEKVENRKLEAEFNTAMSAAQAEMEPIARDSNNPQTRSRYASYYALDKEARPIYTKYGFSLSFDTGIATLPTDVCLICYVAKGGYMRPYRLEMPADGKGAKGGDVMTRTHATKSGITYGKRTLLEMIFNLAVGGDDDGNAASTRPAPPRPATPGPYITPIQLEELRAMLDNSPEREKRFCNQNMWEGATLEELPPKWLELSKNIIREANAKRARQAPQSPAGAFSDHDPITGEVTAPPRPTQRPRPPRPVQTVAPAPSSRPSITNTSNGIAPADGTSHDAPDFATANIRDILAWTASRHRSATDEDEANDIWDREILYRLKQIPHPANQDTVFGSWMQLNERFR